MLARSIVSLGAAVLLWPAVAGPGGQAHGQDTRPGIAVFPFNNGGSYGQNKEDFAALGRGIAGMMISELSTNPGARLVDRQQIQRLVDEQNPGTPGRDDAQTSAKRRKHLAA